MSTLKAFSEQEHAYDRYQARQDFLRQQSCIQARLHEAETALEERGAALAAERQAKEAALQAKDAALAEVERLKALLQAERPAAGS